MRPPPEERPTAAEVQAKSLARLARCCPKCGCKDTRARAAGDGRGRICRACGQILYLPAAADPAE